jgi:16S rRNA C967 or C1407 C5-methylase (RsmB/RsmF family)
VTNGELLRTGSEAESVEAHPLALKVARFPFHWITQGLCHRQDSNTLTACDLLNPQPGETILDACAAPGGKTSHLAQLMRSEGSIVACKSSSTRLQTLEDKISDALE